MRDAYAQFKAEVTYGDILLIDIAATEPSKAGFKLVYRLRRKDDDKTTALASTNMAFFDYIKRRPTRMPEPFKTSLWGG